jgi:hypothetical protein
MTIKLIVPTVASLRLHVAKIQPELILSELLDTLRLWLVKFDGADPGACDP